MAMGSGNDAKRTVIHAAVIEVNSHRDHIFENFRWRLDLPHAGLPGPGIETGNVMPLGHGNYAVLVPAQRPVDVLNLVEEEGAGGKREVAERQDKFPKGFERHTRCVFGEPLLFPELTPPRTVAAPLLHCSEYRQISRIHRTGNALHM